MRKLYPDVPTGFPQGSLDAEGDYLHLIDCYLELLADRELMGSQRTAKAMEFWSQDHYTWVYRTVLRDEARIGAVVTKYDLIPR